MVGRRGLRRRGLASSTSGTWASVHLWRTAGAQGFSSAVRVEAAESTMQES